MAAAMSAVVRLPSVEIRPEPEYPLLPTSPLNAHCKPYCRPSLSVTSTMLASMRIWVGGRSSRLSAASMRSYSAGVLQTSTELLSSSAMTRTVPRLATVEPVPWLMPVCEPTPDCPKPVLPVRSPVPELNPLLPNPLLPNPLLPNPLLPKLLLPKLLLPKLLLVEVPSPGATPLLVLVPPVEPPKIPDSTPARCRALPFCTR